MSLKQVWYCISTDSIDLFSCVTMFSHFRSRVILLRIYNNNNILFLENNAFKILNAFYSKKENIYIYKYINISPPNPNTQQRPEPPQK